MKLFGQFSLQLLFVSAIGIGISFAQNASVNTDTIKATSYLATIVPVNQFKVKYAAAGLMSGPVKLNLVRHKKTASISFNFPKNAEIVATGIGVRKVKYGQKYPIASNLTSGYKLMLSMASDSAENFVIYSAYAFLPDIAKWKLIGTCKLPGYISSLQKPGTYLASTKRDTARPSFKEIWVQRSNGSWKSLDKQNQPSPIINLLSHADSIPQIAIETSYISKAIASGKTEATDTHKGIYYHIINEGTGNVVQPTDTVKIFYKGYLFSDGTIFDQTKEEPRSFPLNRLIQGWQIGLPLLKEGGKIKLVIPSHLAYSIRTRSPKIPPNSTLVFEIEVVDTKPAVK